MPKYLIERELPGAGRLSPAELAAVSRASCDVLRELCADIRWVQSYVTGDRITCVYLAPDAELVREHARRGGFPANRVEEIVADIDPSTADADAQPSSADGP